MTQSDTPGRIRVPGAAVGHDQPVPEEDPQAIAALEDDLQRFLSAWYGEPDLTDRPEQDPAPTCPIPGMLAGWHRQAARWSRPLTRINQLLGPGETWHDGEVLVVCVEQQGTWLWGVVPGQGDPAVLERSSEAGLGWTPTGERLSDYLLHAALVEAVLSAPAQVGLDDASRDQLRLLTEQMSTVRAAPWRWPGPEHALWQRGGALALTCVNRLPDTPAEPDSTSWVVIGGRHESDLGFARELGVRFDVDTDPALDTGPAADPDPPPVPGPR